jgi:ABC-type uncharacterized transport system involved in gliding motility auxiliary subunit
VRDIELSDSTQPGPDVVALVLAGTPDSLAPAELQRLEAFLNRGGSALVLASGMEVSQRAPTAQPRPVAWNALLRPLGVTIRSDMVYDLLANEVIPLPTDFGRVLQVYPFFIRAQSTRASPVNQDLGAVVLTWASTIDTTGATKGTLTPLFGSSQAAGTFTNVTTIAPTQDFPQTELRPRLLAVMVTPPPAPEGGQPRGRVVVVGSLDFATDRFVRTAPENLAFTLNAIDWLAQDEDLIAIRSKDRRPPPLLFESRAIREGVKYANLVGLPLLVGLVGVVRLIRRRRRTREPYRPLVPAAGSAA